MGLPLATLVLVPVLGSGLAQVGEIAEVLDILAPVMTAPLLPYGDASLEKALQSGTVRDQMKTIEAPAALKAR